MTLLRNIFVKIFGNLVSCVSCFVINHAYMNSLPSYYLPEENINNKILYNIYGKKVIIYQIKYYLYFQIYLPYILDPTIERI